MLYLLGVLGDHAQIFNVFRYITFRTGGAIMTALMVVFLFGPALINHLRLRQGKGQPIRSDGPQIASQQGRHADHGRADDPARRRRRDDPLGQSRPTGSSGWCSPSRSPSG